MNAIQLLEHEHQVAKRAFGQIKTAGPEDREPLWAKLRPELKVHEQMEERALYGPVAEQAGSKDAKLAQWREHHHEEVVKAEGLIQQIDQLDPASDQWMDTVATLQQALEHHIREEEGDIWPRIQQVWDAAKLERAGQEMENLKRELMPRAA
jgi:hemerythrin-like domain-containing protein